MGQSCKFAKDHEEKPTLRMNGQLKKPLADNDVNKREYTLAIIAACRSVET